MGRILQVQEKDEMGKEVEAEVQGLATVALGYLELESADTEVFEAAQDVLRSLPARTTDEIQFVWQIVGRTADSRVHAACAGALLSARPKDSGTWRELKKGKTSHVKEVRDAVEKVLKQRIRWSES
jgi:hypothetical protein